WRTQRDELLAALLDQLWTGSHFMARGALSGRVSTSSSLLTLMPLVLGKRLPAPVLEALADGIRAHLTEHGLATEPTGSAHYEDDGYWRGPIWAPSTALIEDGLRTGGFTDLADAVSARFRALCERSGFAENFDARTGAGLRDRAYTWTAAVYLILAADHARRTQ
ncbi:MAG: MGH1-like glycoside hydrolase domain-containing protein, partial [Ornithinibacter sp.]